MTSISDIYSAQNFNKQSLKRRRIPNKEQHDCNRRNQQTKSRKPPPIHARDGGWAGWRLCRLPGDDPGLSDTQPIELTATPLTGVLKPSARIISLDRSLGSHRDGSGTGTMSNCTYWAKTRRSRDFLLAVRAAKEIRAEALCGPCFSHCDDRFFFRGFMACLGLTG